MFLSNQKTCLDMVIIAGVISVFAIHITVTASMPHYHDSTTPNQEKKVVQKDQPLNYHNFHHFFFRWPAKRSENERYKRSSGDVEFMGMRVSYPQYLRLKSIQAEVIRMDQTIRMYAATHTLKELNQNPHWLELVDLYESMKKILPKDYHAEHGYEHEDPMAILYQ